MWKGFGRDRAAINAVHERVPEGSEGSLHGESVLLVRAGW